MQATLVLIIISLAILFVGIKMFAKRKSFSKSHGCADDCGCGSGGKNLTS